MRSVTTREFMAGVAIAQQFGRPYTPTDQAWIESLFGHIKAEWPHLEHIQDPGELEIELERVRVQYNSVRLHESLGYVTPDDELEGRGEGIRQARVWSVARQFVPAVVRVNVGRSPGCRGVAVPRFIAPAEARVVAAQVELLKGTF